MQTAAIHNHACITQCLLIIIAGVVFEGKKK